MSCNVSDLSWRFFRIFSHLSWLAERKSMSSSVSESPTAFTVFLNISAGVSSGNSLTASEKGEFNCVNLIPRQPRRRIAELGSCVNLTLTAVAMSRWQDDVRDSTYFSSLKHGFTSPTRCIACIASLYTAIILPPIQPNQAYRKAG